MERTLRVGIIGASARRGWARDAHVPAVTTLPGLELHAIATSRQASADEAAHAFGAQAAYGDPAALIADPRVDIVTVAVPVPGHRDLVLAALAAGKHVYSEWPLARDVDEALELAQAAARSDRHHAVGLQARMNPAAREAARLLREGGVGRVLSASVVSTTMAFGPTVEDAMAFGEDAGNGATLVTIQGGHTVDLALHLLGGFAAAGGLATTQFPSVELGQAREVHRRSTADHLLVQARLAGGGALSIEVAGGRPAALTPFSFEVVGENGRLTLTGGAPRGFQSGRLELRRDGVAQPVEEGELSSLADAAQNVGGIYAALRDDIRQGTTAAPGFAHAVRLTRLMDDLVRKEHLSAAADWPRD